MLRYTELKTSPAESSNSRQVYSNQKLNQLVESTNNYGTATEHELTFPYPKHVADRFEAEYDYCMRWACDAKFVAAKVIPFQSNFYSVVRLMFKGRSRSPRSLKCSISCFRLGSRLCQLRRSVRLLWLAAECSELSEQETHDSKQ